MVSGVLEINDNLFINFNKVLRIDFADWEDGRHVVVRFEKDDNMLDYGIISAEREAKVKQKLRGENDRQDVGF